MERWLKIIGVTVGLVFAVFFVLYHHSPAWRQARNLALAEEWKPAVRSALSVRGLSDLTVGSYTGEGGTLWVLGTVPDERAALAVREAVESVNPPLRVKYSIRVMSRIREQARKQGELTSTPGARSTPATEPAGVHVTKPDAARE